jgi:hypothetical protein
VWAARARVGISSIPAGLETTAAGELALEQPQGWGPATARAGKKLHTPPLGQRKWERATTKAVASRGAGKATVAVLASGRISPAARMRETEREGKSSIALSAWRKTSVWKGQKELCF